jgi:hypothetical protein
MRLAWSRAVVDLFWFATAAYCLLSAIPFASEQFLKPGLVPALAIFAGWHPWISAAALAFTGVMLAPPLRSRNRPAQALVAGWALAGLALFLAPPLSTLAPSRTALVFSLLALVPPVWLSMTDPGQTSRDEARPSNAGSDASRDFAACALAALVVTAVHAASAVPAVVPLGVRDTWLGITRSLLLHLVVFSTTYAVICVIRGLSGLTSHSSTVEEWLARGSLSLALAIFIFTIVLRSLSVVGGRAGLVAAAFGVALAVVLGPRGTGARPGLEQALAGLVPAWSARSPLTASAWFLTAGIGIVLLERQAAGSDWNFTVAKTTALASWLLALAAALRIVPARIRGREPVPFALCFVVLGLHLAASRTGIGASSESDLWKVRDPSVRLIADALTPRAPDSDPGLADFLQLHTNIPRSTHVAPVPITLARLEGPPSAIRPHIFLFVIDSLRRDYLSSYNRKVTFTPAFDRFARESTVFDRAFSRYGATGLSVPSLWVGGLVLHKQYVTPFAPMNTLARLLDHEQYEQWVSMDNILDVILPATPRRRPLDAGVQVADYRFCRTLDEIRGRLTTGGPPTFVYSLPQDIHVSAISREGNAPVDAGSYPGFYPPYASRVKRMDACFGSFIEDLKARGLFDLSIIIVTADHGDSLGEQGRMGHAYTIFPEIVQVPLIVHLPSRMATGFRADTSAPVFTSDLSPTLYALLGHEPGQPAPFFGRPLFQRQGSVVPTATAGPQLIASSYGSVYGTLLDDARRLYVFDGIALRDYVYELDGSGAGRPLSVTAGDRARGQRAIRATVEDIAAFYRYRP